jgi:GTP-dependent phosphoenolpyruvate carboxykinase
LDENPDSNMPPPTDHGRQLAYRMHRVLGKEAAIGWQPRYEDINWDGVDFPKQKVEELQRLDRTAWHT